MNYYERNAIERINEITDNSELRRHLLSVEILIKELVGDDPYLFYSSRAQNYEKFERVESLIELRLLILNKIFGATDNEVHRFEKLNALLLELTNQMYARTCLLYRNTLRYADYSWDDDYEVEGTLSCHPEYDKDDSNHHDILRLEEDNYYGSDFAYMAALICEYEEYYNGSFGENIEMCSIQHNSKNTPDLSDKQLECVNDLEDGTTWAEGWLCHPKLEHICMCHAVHSLVCHHAFSIPDMLRINDFWVEASIKVQHITDQTGKQWKDIDYDS